jgi:class 3 adenylate cyclase
MNNLPVGTVTFLFSDIEGNTPLWERDSQAMDAAMQIHHAILRQAIADNGGVVFKVIGDEFQAAFPTALQALLAALQAQRGLQAAAWNELGPLRVRMGMHTGEAHLDAQGDEYAVSHTKNRGHRVMEAGHGDQILLSQESVELCQRSLPEGVTLKDLGEHHIRNWNIPEHFYQVVSPDLPKDFPPLRTQVEPRHNLPAQLTSFIGRKRDQQVDLLKETAW